MITPAHARMARAALKWSLIDLRDRTGLSKTTLVRFEAGLGVQYSTAISLEETFAKAGVNFVYEDDSRGLGIQLSKELSRRLNEGTPTSPKPKSAKRSRKAK